MRCACLWYAVGFVAGWEVGLLVLNHPSVGVVGGTAGLALAAAARVPWVVYARNRAPLAGAADGPEADYDEPL